jgi:TonB dependent receptor/TonB-dependent Receptor Plug Domain
VQTQFWKRIFSIFLLTFAICVSADDSISLERISVIGNYDNGLGTSDAASQGVVTRNLIENRPALRTGELLEFVPNLIVSQHSGNGKANQYYLRGFNLDHGTDFATFVDRVPVNMRTHAHGQGYTDLNFLIPELVNRIDYNKGPYFAEEGDFASAGSAHMHLLNHLPTGIANTTFGTYGYQRAVLANSYSLLDGNLLYGLEINHNNGPWDNPENLKKLSGVLRYSNGTERDGFNLTAMAYHNQWDSTDQIPLRAVRSNAIDRFDTIDDTNGGESSRYSLSFARYFQDQNEALHFNIYALRSKLDLYSNFTYFLNNPIDGDQFNQSEDRATVGFNVTKTWFTDTFGLAIQNKVGIQTRYDDLSPVALFNTVASKRTSRIRSDEVRELSNGFFAENNTQWHEKFRSVVGLRFDQYYFDVKSSIQANSGKEQDHITSPKLSLIFGPWAETEFFINYGEGFHSNDARGTTQTVLPNGDPALPVTALAASRGSEVGIRTEIIPNLQSSLAIWQLNLDSELLYIGDAGETEPTRASKRKGIEWSNHYIANDWLLFDFGLAFSQTRYKRDDGSGQYIPGSLGRVMSFGATVNNLNNWSGAFQLRHFGPRPLIEDNSVKSNSTTIAYARVAYQFNPKTKVTLDVFNLFNRKQSDIDYFYTSRLNGEGIDGVEDKHFHPVEPISVRLTLNYSF